MKKRMNLFCILMLVVLAAEIILGFVFNWDSFVTGWRDGANESGLSADKFVMPWWVLVISAVVVLYFGIRSFVSFVRLILNVNRDKVFVWDNVRLLRWTGGGLLVVVVASVICELYSHVPAKTVCSEYIDMVIFGVFSLVVSEVFAIGLKLQEEQDLTI